MANIELVTRIVLNNDTDENWGNNSSAVLLKGEPVIDWVNGVPKLKIGDGIKTFGELPFLSMGGESEGSLEVIISGTGNGLANASYLDGILTITKGSFLTEHQDISGKLDKNESITAIKTPSLLKLAYDTKGLITNSEAITKEDITNLGIPSTNTTYTFEEGITNGTFKIIPSEGLSYYVKVHGLGSAAYTDSTDYATADQGILATGAMPKSGGIFTGAPIWETAPVNDDHLANKKYVDDSIKSKITSVFRIKGTKPTFSDLPMSGNEIGDVWLVEENHLEYFWVIADNAINPSWEPFGGTIDLSNYALKADLKPFNFKYGESVFTYSPLTESNFTFTSGSNIILSLSSTGLNIDSVDTKLSDIPNNTGSVLTGVTNGTTASTTNVGLLLLSGFTASSDTGAVVATDTIAKALNKIYNLADSKTSNSGTITSITVGAGLSGGTITTTGTISHGSKPNTGTELSSTTSSSTNLRFLTGVSIDTYGHIAETFSKIISIEDLGAISSINSGTGIKVTGTGTSKTISINTDDVFILNGGDASSIN